MDDAQLSRMVAKDLHEYLADAGSSVEGPVYAISLWADAVYAQFGVMLATQASFERRRPAAVSDEEAYGPACRWYSGDWEMQPTDFLGPATVKALQPMSEVLNDASLEMEVYEPLWRRWWAIAYTAVEQLHLPATLPLTPDALCYVEMPDTTRAEAADVMLHTVSPSRFHAVIPAWRTLADAVRAVRADPAALSEVRHRAEEARAGRHRFPWYHEAAPDLLTARLRACGLQWYDVASETEQLALALAIADRR